MELRHYSAAPFELEARHYPQDAPSMFGKPNGFWVSVKGDDDWISWVEQEGFMPEKFVIENEVTLHEANFLVLETIAEMETFQESYGAILDEYRDYLSFSRHYSINWARVAQDFGGIIIPNYQWSARWTMNWYNGWDVASGCFWDLSIIKSIKALTNADS